MNRAIAGGDPLRRAMYQTDGSGVRRASACESECCGPGGPGGDGEWIEGIPCPGQDQPYPSNPWFKADGVTACDVIRVGSHCYLVSPGVLGTPPDGATLVITPVDGRNGGKCCTCVSQCETPTAVILPCDIGESVRTIECCCANARTVELLEWTATVSQPYFGSVALKDATTTKSGGRWVYDNDGNLINTIPAIQTTVVRYWHVPNDPNDPGNIDFTETSEVSPAYGCGYFTSPDASGLPRAAYYSAAAGMGDCPVYLVGNPNVVARSVTRVNTCTDFIYEGRWDYLDPTTGAVAQTLTARVVWHVGYSGRCGGQCGQSPAQAIAVTSWLGMDWYGTPLPLKVWSYLTGRGWPEDGCGCIKKAKDWTAGLPKMLRGWRG